MRRVLVLMAFAAAMVAHAPAWASPGSDTTAPGPAMRLPLEGIVTNPDWVKKPTPEVMSNYYPQIAATLAISGHVTMQCDVLTTGFVANCQVGSEAPIEMGFGDAALAMAKYFQMKPMTFDGAPVAGGRVIIPIGFQIPADADDVAPTAAPPGPPPSARALELAHRIAAVVFSPEQTKSAVDLMREQFSARFANQPLTEREQAAIDDYLAAAQDDLAKRTDTVAQVYADYYSEAQLAQAAAFFE